ncbi:MAG: hypothetical protein WAL29_13950 [Bacteroidales bacterium]
MKPENEVFYPIVYYMSRRGCASLAEKSELALDLMMSFGKFFKASEDAKIELNNELYKIFKKHNIPLPTTDH